MTREELERGAEDEEMEEALREAEALYESDDLSNLVPVEVRVSKPVRHVFSLKIGAGELDVIADAAEAAGLSVGAFIRTAALEKARETNPEVAVEVELTELAGRLASIAGRIREGDAAATRGRSPGRRVRNRR